MNTKINTDHLSPAQIVELEELRAIRRGIVRMNKKSRGLCFLLTLLFGPFGLLYIKISAFFMMALFVMPILILMGIGLLAVEPMWGLGLLIFAAIANPLVGDDLVVRHNKEIEI